MLAKVALHPVGGGGGGGEGINFQTSKIQHGSFF